MHILLVIVGLVAVASAKNLTVGHGGGSLVFEQNRTASPAIWKQEERVFVNVSDSEIITQVDVIDRREDQNGEVSILEGGVGSKNVTIELKSPSILRGYDFAVFIYAVPDEGQVLQTTDDNQQNVQHKHQSTSVSTSTTQVPDGQQEVQHDGQVSHFDQQEVQHPGQVSRFDQQETQHSNMHVPHVPSVSTSTTQVPDGQQKVQHPGQVSRFDQQEVQHADQVSQHGQQVRPSRHTEGQEQKPRVYELIGKDIQKHLIADTFEEEDSEEEITQKAKGYSTVAPVSTTKRATEKSLQTDEQDIQQVHQVRFL